MPARPIYDEEPFDPEVQRIQDDTEKQIYGETGGVSTDENIERRFYRRFDESRNSVLCHDVLRTDHWQLRGTMQQLADHLGTDHGTISRWLHRGILPHNLESRLMACRTRPDDWQKPIDDAFSTRQRAGNLAVAKYLYERLPGHSPTDGAGLREIHWRLLFVILRHRASWRAIQKNLDSYAAHKLVSDVCKDPKSDLYPVWYLKKESRKVSLLIDWLHSDRRIPLKYLALLMRSWEGVFLLTRAATELLAWSDPWQKSDSALTDRL